MVNTVEKHVTVDNQEVIKKRKLNGNAGNTPQGPPTNGSSTG
jgi:hypothetical protein